MVAITDEMKNDLMRTAYNVIIYEAEDIIRPAVVPTATCQRASVALTATTLAWSCPTSLRVGPSASTRRLL